MLIEIDCINNHTEHFKKVGDRFLTTKTIKKEIHGLGIQSMRRAVDKLHGKFNIDYTEKLFHVNIIFPNYP